MGLLGTRTVTTTLAAIAAAGSTSFAHGLPSAPHFVFFHENATTNSTTAIKLAWAFDATNISIYNHGTGNSATLYGVAMAIHSLVQ